MGQIKRMIVATAIAAPLIFAVTPAQAAPLTLPGCVAIDTIHSDIGDYLSWNGYNAYGLSSFANGVPVTTLRDPSGPLPQWCVEQATGSGNVIYNRNVLPYGGYFLLPVAGQGNWCLDAGPKAVGMSGSPQIWSCNGTPTQVWCWNGQGYIPVATALGKALKDNYPAPVTLATGNASQWYLSNQQIPNSCPY